MSAMENQIVVYQPNETVRLDVLLENETVWLTQLKIAELFGVQKAAISKHIKNIFASGELIRESTVSKMETVQIEGGRSVVRIQEFFNLDVIIAVGYRVNSQRATQFRIWATGVLKEYLLRGYSVNVRMNQLEDAMHRNFARHNERIIALEEKVDFFVQTQTPPLQGVFYDGQLWDARVLVLSLISGAKKSLILIDNWVTAETLDLFAKKRKGVNVTVITSEHIKKGVAHHTISDSDIATFNAQYPKLTIRYNETFHDRFLIVDDKELYLIGASLKDLGKKCFAFTKLDAGEIARIKKAAFASVDNLDDRGSKCYDRVGKQSLLDDISGVADSLMALYKQSYDILQPVVDDMCLRKGTVTQDELDHCFDSVSEIACTDFGKKLFDRLCVAFKSKYPESVNFYIKEYEKLCGEEDGDDKVSKAKSRKGMSRSGNGKKGGLK